MSSRLARAALGLVAVILFVGAVGLTWVYLKGGFVSGVPVDAVFSSPGVGQQLPVGGDVKIRGVLVGRINDISLDDDGRAIVEMRLDDGLGIPADTIAEIRSKTAFGQKWIELLPRAVSGTEDVLREGSVIPDANTREPLELERELQVGHELLSRIPLGDLSDLFNALAEGFSGQEKDARRAIDKGLVALRAVNARAGKLDLGLRQLGEFSQWLDDHDTDLLSFMESLDANNRALVGAAPEFRASLDSVPVFLDSFSAFQEAIEDDLGRLVEDGATVAEIVAARSDDLTDIVVQLRAFTTVFNSGFQQPCAGLFESDMTCLQVYELAGFKSRGLYNDDFGPTLDSFQALLGAYTDRDVPEELARLLYAPVSNELAEALGESR